MYVADRIPAQQAAQVSAGQSVAPTEFAVASADPGRVAGRPVQLARWTCPPPRGLPPGTELLIPPGGTYRIDAVDPTVEVLWLTLVQ